MCVLWRVFFFCIFFRFVVVASIEQSHVTQGSNVCVGHTQQQEQFLLHLKLGGGVVCLILSLQHTETHTSHRVLGEDVALRLRSSVEPESNL